MSPIVTFIVGKAAQHFFVPRRALIERAPNFYRMSLPPKTSVLFLDQTEPAIFQYLVQILNTDTMNNVEETADDALITLAKLWVLAEVAGNKVLQNRLMKRLYGALNHSHKIREFLQYAYSIPEPSTGIRSQEDETSEAQFQKQQDPLPPPMLGLGGFQTYIGSSIQGYTIAAKGGGIIDGPQNHMLKRLAMHRVVWTMNKETLNLVG